MEFASKFVLDRSDSEESLSDEDLQYSDSEPARNASDDERVDEGEAAKERATLRTAKVRKADTNVVGISLRTLSEDAELLTGDPIFCKSCAAVLNRLSKISKAADKEKEGEGEGEEEKGESVWRCEFCNTVNAVDIEEEEIPTAESGDYILDMAGTTESTKKAKAGLTVFCIDISGSMCVTTEVAGTHKLKGHERVAQLSSLNTERVNQYLPGQKRNITYVSRLQCVQAAVEAYMDKLTVESPDALVGLVTFNGDVTIIGDGGQVPKTITGDKLNQYEALLEAGSNSPVRRTIKESHEALSKQLFAIEETGPTALGPALLVALGIAGQVPGAQVVLCTDGLANVGLGAQDELKTDEAKHEVRDFYENMASFAADKGISVSVVSIKGTEAKMENLGMLADGSGGQVNIVDPLELHKEFASILSESVIATNVAVDFVLHRGLYFRNEEAPKPVAGAAAVSEVSSAKDEVKQKKKASRERGRRERVEKQRDAAVKEAKKKEKSDRKAARKDSKRVSKKDKEENATSTTTTTTTTSTPEVVAVPEHKRIATRQLGNVTKETQITFEFGADHSYKPPQEVTELPFQVQIRFTTLDGKRCIRCITKAQPVTKDREVAEQDANIQILGLNSAQQSAKMAFDGEYTGARLNSYAQKKLLKRAKKDEEDEGFYSGWKANLTKMDRKLQYAQQTERSRGLNLSDDEADDGDHDRASSRRSESRDREAPKKSKTRSESRQDSMSTYLYQMKSTNSSKPGFAKKKK